jgi:uncharacterized surface protein with fasciclin (FAS1) repeats
MNRVIKLISVLFVSCLLISGSTFAQEKKVIVGGAAMYPAKNIIENAANSKVHTILVSAIKAAALTDTLSSAGPFTVFASTNQAFNKLPAGTVKMLLKPENKDALTKVLAYHVVAGRINSSEIVSMIEKNGGSFKLKTMQGGELNFILEGKNILIKDEKGGVSRITIADVEQSNGVIHVINTVLMPKS